MVYNSRIFKILQTETFRCWLHGLRDDGAVVRITARLRRAAQGNLGDVRAVRDGVFEMRIHYGPGYRLHFIRRGSEIIVLICGGDKSSQRRDIERAKRLSAKLEE